MLTESLANILYPVKVTYIAMYVQLAANIAILNL